MSKRNVVRHPCTRCGEIARSVTGLCRDCRPVIKPAQRKEGPCKRCGKRTTAKTGECRSCTRPPIPVSSDIHALTEGSWHVRRGVQVWISWDAA